MSETRKTVDEALAEKVRLLDLTTDAIIVRDASDRITFWNNGATHTYGYSREEAIGRVSHDLFRTEFPEPFERIKKEFIRDGKWGGELKHTCANGSRITVSTRWVAERDLAGNITSVLESNRDITEIKRAMEAQSRIAAIVESSDDAIVSKNLDGTITSWNRAAEQVFGYAATEAIGRNITIIVPPDRLEEEANILARLQRGERVDHFETIRRKKDGTVFEVSVTISPVKDVLGRVIGASKVARDITERKRLEQFRRDAELSGRLLQLQEDERRRVARELHDGVGQLLAVLGMNLSAVADRAQLTPDDERCLAEAVSLTDQATSEIRTLSHLLHPPFLDEVGLKSALNEYVHGFGHRSKIRVALNLPDELERLPRDLELSLFRIVQECLTNIHRHSGSPSASVGLSRTQEQVQLEVSDEGRGISSEIQERFSTGKSSGVGLRGMRERVHRLGGEMKIRTSGSGTAVVVTLPLRGDGNQEPNVP